jgi:hypothetical protein
MSRIVPRAGFAYVGAAFKSMSGTLDTERFVNYCARSNACTQPRLHSGKMRIVDENG